MKDYAHAGRLFIADLRSTEVGDLLLAASEHGLVAVEWAEQQDEFMYYLRRLGAPVLRERAALKPYAAEVRSYLAGERMRFSFAIDWSHFTGFQRRVLRATFAIPYGQTRTYAEIAARVGRAAAARAVGRVQATNPMPIVIPCHRVVGSDGRLHGYGGGEGLKTKRWLLDLEARSRQAGSALRPA